MEQKSIFTEIITCLTGGGGIYGRFYFMLSSHTVLFVVRPVSVLQP
jgi:hypothetical protein